jgi:hypothetical protein
MKISDLQVARDSNNIKFLQEQFSSANKIIAGGGSVRVEQEYSDGSVETIHVIDSLEELKRLEKKYLP